MNNIHKIKDGVIIDVSIYEDYIYPFTNRNNKIIDIDNIPEDFKKCKWKFVAYDINVESDTTYISYEVISECDGNASENFADIRKRYYLFYGFYFSNHEYAKLKLLSKKSYD